MSVYINRFHMSPKRKIPFVSGEIVGAGGAVPGAVRIPGQATVSASLPIELTPLQGQLNHCIRTADEQSLLKTKKTGKYLDIWMPVHKYTLLFLARLSEKNNNTLNNLTVIRSLSYLTTFQI